MMTVILDAPETAPIECRVFPMDFSINKTFWRMFSGAFTAQFKQSLVVINDLQVLLQGVVLPCILH